ncbi:MAG: hypothetical protein J6I49_08380 [Bacteroidales bacterium]|nr:hypothetical protein [Bacteroidales bacterium]
MKKLLIVLVAMGLAAGVGAQKVLSLKENAFLSLNGGMTMYLYAGDSPTMGYNASAALGQWIIRPLAFRLAYDGVFAPSYSKTLAGLDGDVVFHMVSGQFLWDIPATLGRVHLFGNHLGIYPIVGLGLLRRGSDPNLASADNEFQTMLGLQLAWHRERDSRLDIFLEAKNFFLPQGFDGSHGSNNFLNANLGLSYYWGRSYYRGRRANESRNIQEDWFIGFGGGALFSSFEFEYFLDKKALKLWHYVPEVMLGRNYSSAWTIRFELTGLFARERYKQQQVLNPDGSISTEYVPGLPYKFTMLHADLMLNLLGLDGTRPGRKWAIMPYIGAGPIWRYDSHPVFNVAGDAGLFFRRYISPEGDFYMDLKYIMVTPRTAGGYGPSGNILGVGYPMFTIGYIHNFNHSTTGYRQPSSHSTECAF